jgi:predicted RNA-binding protein YlqC (UPF0109 family)
MEELITYIAKSLVDRPDQVDVRKVPGRHAVIYELRVAEEDRGRVIGREGQTIQAIRTILKAATASDHKPILEIPG